MFFFFFIFPNLPPLSCFTHETISKHVSLTRAVEASSSICNHPGNLSMHKWKKLNVINFQGESKYTIKWSFKGRGHFLDHE